MWWFTVSEEEDEILCFVLIEILQHQGVFQGPLGPCIPELRLLLLLCVAVNGNKSVRGFNREGVFVCGADNSVTTVLYNLAIIRLNPSAISTTVTSTC